MEPVLDISVISRANSGRAASTEAARRAARHVSAAFAADAARRAAASAMPAPAPAAYRTAPARTPAAGAAAGSGRVAPVAGWAELSAAIIRTDMSGDIMVPAAIRVPRDPAVPIMAESMIIMGSMIETIIIPENISWALLS